MEWLIYTITYVYKINICIRHLSATQALAPVHVALRATSHPRGLACDKRKIVVVECAILRIKQNLYSTLRN